MSLRVANNNVSASVPVDTTNATNTENNEENTNQMTCVIEEFFFLILRSFGTPFFGLSFYTENFLSREFNIHAR